MILHFFCVFLLGARMTEATGILREDARPEFPKFPYPMPLESSNYTKNLLDETFEYEIPKIGSELNDLSNEIIDFDSEYSKDDFHDFESDNRIVDESINKPINHFSNSINPIYGLLDPIYPIMVSTYSLTGSNEPINPINSINEPINQSKNSINTTSEPKKPINPINEPINEPVNHTNEPINHNLFDESINFINGLDFPINKPEYSINEHKNPIASTNKSINAINEPIDLVNRSNNSNNEPNNPINQPQEPINPVNHSINQKDSFTLRKEKTFIIQIELKLINNTIKLITIGSPDPLPQLTDIQLKQLINNLRNDLTKTKSTKVINVIDTAKKFKLLDVINRLMNPTPVSDDWMYRINEPINRINDEVTNVHLNLTLIDGEIKLITIKSSDLSKRLTDDQIEQLANGLRKFLTETKSIEKIDVNDSKGKNFNSVDFNDLFNRLILPKSSINRHHVESHAVAINRVINGVNNGINKKINEPRPAEFDHPMARLINQHKVFEDQLINDINKSLMRSKRDTKAGHLAQPNETALDKLINRKIRKHGQRKVEIDMNKILMINDEGELIIRESVKRKLGLNDNKKKYTDLNELFMDYLKRQDGGEDDDEIEDDF